MSMAWPEPPIGIEIPRTHEKYAALGITLRDLPDCRQWQILAALSPEMQAIVMYYRNQPKALGLSDRAKLRPYQAQLAALMTRHENSKNNAAETPLADWLRALTMGNVLR